MRRRPPGNDGPNDDAHSKRKPSVPEDASGRTRRVFPRSRQDVSAEPDSRTREKSVARSAPAALSRRVPSLRRQVEGSSRRPGPLTIRSLVDTERVEALPSNRALPVARDSRNALAANTHRRSPQGDPRATAERKPRRERSQQSRRLPRIVGASQQSQTAPSSNETTSKRAKTGGRTRRHPTRPPESDSTKVASAAQANSRQAHPSSATNRAPRSRTRPLRILRAPRGRATLDSPSNLPRRRGSDRASVGREHPESRRVSHSRRRPHDSLLATNFRSLDGPADPKKARAG